MNKSPLLTAAAAVMLLAAAPTAAHAAPRKLPKKVQVELGLTAHHALWTPGSRPGTGHLTLDGIAPRMSMMAVAPRRELIEVPSSTIATEWRPLMGSDRKTNAMLSAVVDGRSRIFPVELELLAAKPSGRKMTFAVTPLHTRSKMAGLPTKPATLEDPALVVDPAITPAIKALWAALLNLFTADPPSTAPVPDPVSNGRSFSTAGGTYKGTDGADITSTANRIAAQKANLDAVGATYGNLTQPGADVTFDAATTNGAAIFNASLGDIDFPEPDAGSRSVRNFALYNTQVDTLSFDTADVGAVNLRGATISNLDTTNTGFDHVDMTGARIGDISGARSQITGSVFQDVVTTRALNDAVTTNSVHIEGVDFVSTSLQNVDFSGADLHSVTFQGSGLSNVDFSGATISGTTGTLEQGGMTFATFEPTFENSILDGAKFDNAKLSNVSFAGVDFSQGVSLTGATLANVDFTGATGLQAIDWSTVKTEGPVYGLGAYGSELKLGQPSDLRSFTTESAIPEVDPQTGYDIQYGSHYFVDPKTGVRMLPEGPFGGLVPIDPRTNRPLVDPADGQGLEYERGTLLDPTNGREFEVDLESGIPEF